MDANLLNKLTENNVQQELEYMLDAMLYSGVDDVYGFMSEHLAKLAHVPSIVKLEGHERLDSRGRLALEVDVHCIVNNISSKQSSVTTAVIQREDECGDDANTTSPTEWDLDPHRWHGKGLKSIVTVVTDTIEKSLHGLDPQDQSAIDKMLAKHCADISRTAVFATSIAVAKAGSILRKCELYQHILDSASDNNSITDGVYMPKPLVAVLSHGKKAAGKLKYREFLLTANPSPFSFSEAIRIICEVQQTLGKALSDKYGPSCGWVGDGGAFTPPLDTAEQALALLQDAITSSGYTVGVDVQIAIDIGTNAFQNKDAKKNELGCTQKAIDECTDLYCTMLDAHPAITMLIDPLPTTDADAFSHWLRLRERIAGRQDREVLVICSDVSRLPPSWTTDHFCDGAGFGLSYSRTLTALNHASQDTQATGSYVVLSCSEEADVAASEIADIAVGMGVHFVRLGGVTRGEHVCKYNRLIRIEEDLIAHGKLIEAENLIRLPPATDDVDAPSS